MSKYKDEVERRLRRLEGMSQIKTREKIPGLTLNWHDGEGSPCYKSVWYGVSKILKLLLDDLEYEIADDGVVLRKKADDEL